MADAPLLDDELAARHAAALAYLFGRINYERVASPPYGERSLKLDRMRTLLARLGNPDAGMPIVHIAGTKGKGSTSALVAAILHAAGFDVGVYSSPHLERLEERFAVNGVPCSPGDTIALVDRLRPIVEQMDEASVAQNDWSLRPTFFELTTAMALMHFADRQVDVVVLEVGLGGRLDSTNVCQPTVTAITSISLDHTRQLGDTTPEIAAEKAGIIKPGVPVVVGPMDEGARQVILDVAREHGCRAILARRDYTWSYRAPHEVDVRESTGRLDAKIGVGDEAIELVDAPLAFLGEHQATNAAAALAVVAELKHRGWMISTDAMRQGLARCSLAGRIEVAGHRPTVILDVAHNVASVEALAATLVESFVPSRRVLVFAASRDKDAAGMLRVLLPLFDRVVLTEFQENPRAVPAEQLADVCRQDLDQSRDKGVQNRKDLLIAVRPQPQEAWELARFWTKSGELLCVTGSFFIVAELRHAATSTVQAGLPAAAHSDAWEIVK